MIRVTVWNEFVHEKTEEAVRAVYPNGIHNCIADFLKTDEELVVRTATLDMPEHGLTQEVLDDTDVLIWWGHMAHDKVCDEVAARVQEAVLKGMGLVVLHSGHKAKVFMRLMGTTCNLKWRDNDRERLWTVLPSHPIAQGVPEQFEVGEQEMYGEPFDIPTPDELVFMGWFRGGEVFRSGCCYRRGLGKVFYFQPGHETNPTYHHPHIQTIIRNAVYWAKPLVRTTELGCPNTPPVEEL